MICEAEQPRFKTTLLPAKSIFAQGNKMLQTTFRLLMLVPFLAAAGCSDVDPLEFQGQWVLGDSDCFRNPARFTLEGETIVQNSGDKRTVVYQVHSLRGDGDEVRMSATFVATEESRPKTQFRYTVEGARLSLVHWETNGRTLPLFEPLASTGSWIRCEAV